MEKIFKEFWIVYQTICTINKKQYIGIHKTATLEFDGYLGNGINIYDKSSYKHPKTIFQYAVNKYGPKCFIRTTLKKFDNISDALDLERWLVTEEFIKDPNTYNMILGGRSEILPTNAVKVYVYNESGTFIKECNSQREAALFAEISESSVYNLIKTGGFSRNHKYQFSKIKYDFMKDFHSYKKQIRKNKIEQFKNKNGLESRFGNPKKVGRYDLNGNLIEVYNSLGECKRAGYTNSQGVIEGKRKKCKGFIFKYED